MNTTFNTALKSSNAIKRDLSTIDSTGPTPAALGTLSASITAFSRTITEYADLAKSELDRSKADKAAARLTQFRAELEDYNSQLRRLKEEREDAVNTANRSELLGRRPYHSTPENPYAGGENSGGYGIGGGHARTASASERGQGVGGQMSFGGEDVSREDHALREQTFFQNTHGALDEYIARGQAVLGSLGEQRDMLKNTQRKLYSAGNTLGISGDTIRMIERRAREDKWIFGAGVIVFFLFCWLCLHYLR